MVYRFLKKFRVAVAVLFLLLLLLVFIDFRKSFPPEFYQWVTSLQLMPSILKSFSIIGGITFGLVVITILTVLFGRVYCSMICPLGILQDIVSWISPRFKRKKRYKFSKPWVITRYTILGSATLLLLFGAVTFVTILDPYSLFGRISTTLFKPVVIIINNIGSSILNNAGIYSWLYRYDPVPVTIWIFILTVLFFIGILIASFYRGRLYCNTLCPVGTLLGLASKISIFKISLDKISCTRCGKCARVCKSECIDVKTQKVDHSRCVACYNCLQVCPDKAIDYKSFTLNKVKIVKGKEIPEDISKRNFLVMSAVGITTLMGFSQPQPEKAKAGRNGVVKTKVIKAKGVSTLPEKKTSPTSPPGSLGIERFNKYCTGCSLCVTACPTKVLQPSFLQYGLIGMMQPHMDYHTGLCEFDCTLCGEVCPTGAITPITMDQKHLTQIGRVQFEKKNCIVETEGTDCGACSEHCPTKSVKMIPYGKLFIPEVDEKICVGCGACEYACPTTPFKAIYVDGNSLHKAAEKPKTEKAKTDLKEGEFPF